MKIKQKISIMKSLHKEAFDMDSITGMILDSFKSLINPNHPVESVLQLIAEGFIFSKFRTTGILISIVLDKLFGINVGSLWNIMSQHLGSFMKQNEGKQVDVEHAAQQITNQTLSSLNIPPEDASKSIDELQIEAFGAKQNDKLIKQAVGGVGGFALGAIFKSIIKAALIGAGFSAGAGLLLGQIPHPEKTTDSKTVTTPVTPTTTQVTTTAPSKTLPQNTILKYVGNPSGDGEIYHRNTADVEESSGYAWYLVSSGEFSRFIYEWIFRIYPDMSDNIENVIYQYYPKIISPIKHEFARWNPEVNIDYDGEEIRIPQSINGIELHTIKDIIDLVLSMYAIKK